MFTSIEEDPVKISSYAAYRESNRNLCFPLIEVFHHNMNFLPFFTFVSLLGMLLLSKKSFLTNNNLFAIRIFNSTIASYNLSCYCRSELLQKDHLKTIMQFHNLFNSLFREENVNAKSSFVFLTQHPC